MAARAASKRPRIPEESGNRDAVAPDQEQPTKRSRLELIEEEVDKTARANSSRLEKGPTKVAFPLLNDCLYSLKAFA